MTQCKSFAALIVVLPFLFPSTAMQGMEQVQLFENKRPTIKAEIWFKPNKSAFYFTHQSIAQDLTSKGITTPIVPIGLKIDKVNVIDPNGTTINWKKEIPVLVRSYEEQQQLLPKKTLTTAEILTGCFAIDKLTFPKRLPAELALHCSNETERCFTIHGFPVEATFKSNGIFHEEYEKSMAEFFDHPCGSLSGTEKDSLVAQNIMTRQPTQLSTDINRLTHLQWLIHMIQAPCPFGHGPQGCSNKERFLELIKNNKLHSCLTPKHKNTTTLFLNRQTGLVRKEPYRQLLAALGILSIKRPQTTPRHRCKSEQVDIESKLLIDQHDQPLLTVLDILSVKSRHIMPKHFSKSEQVEMLNKLVIDQHDQPLPTISEQNADLILEECLVEMEADKILDECFDEFQTNNQQNGELHSRNKDLHHYADECILF